MTEKAKGRPKKADTERAGEWLPGIRVTSEELRQYRAAALAAGLPLSQWVRNALAATMQEPQRLASTSSVEAPEKAEPQPEPPRRLRKALAATVEA